MEITKMGMPYAYGRLNQYVERCLLLLPLTGQVTRSVFRMDSIGTVFGRHHHACQHSVVAVGTHGDNQLRHVRHYHRS